MCWGVCIVKVIDLWMLYGIVICLPLLLTHCLTFVTIVHWLLYTVCVLMSLRIIFCLIMLLIPGEKLMRIH